MNKDDIMEKIKDMIGEGNIEKAKDFIEDHKEDLGEYYEKAKELVKNNAEGVIDKVKDIFGK
ncbi:hypothetical protein ACSAHR_00490 [Pediococcus pentosaceus]|jgi:hypothetical protein|uniref:hypothetical protein n=1 Tax=Pediococcus pentosaceus TaxID=1255 RepID=UPI00132FB640|nr:hypothetical protein [Pediococcus pentosaceus]KAF0467880.1 hypothetical protein GBP05_02870 [Pediococcus pentosaceus]MBF7102155.1 hypothetical protein [Pediococcus pentosaceus]MBF7108882.1 hypothetical protein [Pediococcus pentosaceus]MBF7112809.1 hypothetical protein [Pediococcus pentosaceus]MBF7120990.1 hypothetical protein [Pediococcus pentosaceus]